MLDTPIQRPVRTKRMKKSLSIAATELMRDGKETTATGAIGKGPEGRLGRPWVF